MNAFQLRLELIKLAKEMIEQEYHSKRETVHNNWQVATENARTQGQNLPNQPDFPPFPSEEEVIKNIMLKETVDGQFTTVEDVANMVTYLSKDTGALTGQSFNVSHGWCMK